MTGIINPKPQRISSANSVSEERIIISPPVGSKKNTTTCPRQRQAYNAILYMMRNAIFLSLLLPLCVFSASALSCIDLKVNISKGNESAHVMLLQSFLSEKGLLTAKPNGYFGPGTQKAVQDYQKSKKLNPSGSVLALTRVAIKEETCKTATSTPNVSAAKPNSTSTDPLPPKQETAPQISIEQRPSIAAISKGTIFRSGETTWGLSISGTNFATATANTVYLEDQKSGKRYTAGIFSSADGKTISLPPSLGKIPLTCGTSCKETLNVGGYYVVVKTPRGGESPVSPAQIISVREALIGNATGTGVVAYLATSTRIGTFNFTLYNPTKITSITLNSTSSQFASTTLGKIIFKNEATNETLPNAGAGMELYEGQYMTVGAYANVETTATAVKTVPMSFTLTITDTYGKTTSFTSSPFTVSFDKEPLSVTLSKSTTIPPTIESIDGAMILTNGVTDWGVTLRGKGFNAATNTVYFASRSNQRKYLIGSFPSISNAITLPKSLGMIKVKCGNDCEESLPPGDYDIIVSTKLGESNQKFIQIKSFNVSSVTGTMNAAFHKKVTGARLGTVSIGVGAVLKVNAITPSIKYSNGGIGVSNIIIKDETTGKAIVGSGKDTVFSENDSKVYGMYGDITSTSAGTGDVTLAFDVVDYIGNMHTIITSPAFTISFSIEP